MTHYFQIIILGIVEGVTEFLPISSTGHLLLAEHLLHTSEPDVFNVVIQAGAILAVVFIYWHKIMALFGNLDHPDARQYLAKIFAAFVITGVLGLVTTKVLHMKLPETLTPVAWATLIGGLVIFVIEFLSKNLYPHDDVSWPEAVLIGIAQIVAGIFPGTSRSGATIMTGLAMGMKRPIATEFSFLVGIPTMFAASALEIVKYRKDLTHGGHQLLIDITLGFIISAVVAFFVVKWLLRFVQSHTFNGFAGYRVVLGLVLLIAISTHAMPEIGAIPVPEHASPTAVLAPAQATPTPTPEITPTPTPTPAATTDASSAPVTNTEASAAPDAPRALPVNPTEVSPTPDSASPMTNAETTPAAPSSSTAPTPNVSAPQN